jgi:DNA polymerase-3 subunit epsilon
MPDGTENIKTLRINPAMPIPLESSLVHGIYDEDIKNEPTFKQVGEELARFLDDCDLAGYNSNRFDIPVLLEEFLRNGIDFEIENRQFVDVQNIFHQMEQRTLKAAYLFYCGKNIENAHSAEADIKATYEVLKAQIEKYENVEWEDKKGQILKPVQNNIEALHKFTNLNKPVDFAARMVYNEDGVEVINFGKHKGRPVEEVFQTEPSYYNWMLNGDFPLYTKRCLEKIWNRMNAKKEQLRNEKQNSNNAKASPSNSPKVNEEAKPINTDMLDQLKMKFGK